MSKTPPHIVEKICTARELGETVVYFQSEKPSKLSNHNLRSKCLR